MDIYIYVLSGVPLTGWCLFLAHWQWNHSTLYARACALVNNKKLCKTVVLLLTLIVVLCIWICVYHTMDMSSQQPSGAQGGVLPVFFKHSEALQSVSGLDICLAAANVVGDNNLIEGAQLKRYPRGAGLWRVYLTSNDARARLLAEGLSVGDIAVVLHSQNPFSTGEGDPEKRSVKITVKELSISMADDTVKDMLSNLGINVSSRIMSGYYRDRDGKRTNFKNGNRVAYAPEEDLKKNPLPRKAVCGTSTCKIYHDGQPAQEKRCYKCQQEGHLGFQCPNPKVCTVCKSPDHSAGDTTCKFFKENQDVETFQGARDCLSNFHPCPVAYSGSVAKSSEHLYQAEKARRCGRPEVAEEILQASTAFQAKQMSKKIGNSSSWEQQEENVKLMEDIVRAKVSSVESVREHLVATGVKTLAEAVPSDPFWGTGLSKEATMRTDPSAWPGKNVMGKILMKIRGEVQNKGVKIRIEKKKRRLTPEELEDRRSRRRVGSQVNKEKQSSMTQYMVEKKIEEIRREFQESHVSSLDPTSDDVFTTDEDEEGATTAST